MSNERFQSEDLSGASLQSPVDNAIQPIDNGNSTIEAPRALFQKNESMAGLWRFRTLKLACQAYLPVLLTGRRTNSGVAAYFDLVTPEALRFYGESFHLGYFRTGQESLEQALEAHTDLAGELAGLDGAGEVLDVGCGIGTPAIRLAGQYGCRFTGVNLSLEQVRLAQERVHNGGLNKRIRIHHGTALDLGFDACSFDSVVCMEAAGDICVSEVQKQRLVTELHRVLKPGGLVGFSDLVFKENPTPRENRVVRRLLYHTGNELVTDWPEMFSRNGFSVSACRDVLPQTLKTWECVLNGYQRKVEACRQRYGKRMVSILLEDLELIPEILQRCASYVVLTARRDA